MPEPLVRRATLAEIVALRHAELRPGRPPATACFEGDDAPDTRHYGAFLPPPAGVVGCASFMRRPLGDVDAFQLRGMATRGDLVGRGIGGRLLADAIGLLVAEFGRLPLWCNARTGAVGFYERMGWVVGSDEFDVPDVGPHVVMRAGTR